ncbi:nucleoside-diphosphate sugar epimerase [Mesorhizobium sp. L-8-10]|uniref:NAD-dependent epimerase/dehydratase family protein n=1 Tax=Mesorhizobium sp. L-8-10 TaxID=2744523 RepID=UPI0019265CBF|nr:NAD(P)-dependent oxidoreductase [Mesorhizobium sp. L-8-10]BCH29795.1 nucleoside-diphosphate sugar epimerase [Mesorhizobium sp. L-8-10]
MAVLVTGGKGFIGARVVRELVRRGHAVTAFDLRGTPGRLAPLRDKISFEAGDITDYDRIADVIRGHRIDRIAHMVFYMAEERGVSLRPENADGLYRQQMIMNTGTFHVFEAARRAGVRRIAYPSSVQYHAGDEPWTGTETVNEDSPAMPTTTYGMGKVLCEKLAKEYNRLHGMEIISLRIPGAYGPGATFGARGINLIATEGALGQKVALPYSSEQRVVLAHVDDIAWAFAEALDIPAPGHDTYHIGGHYVSYADIAALGREITPGLDVTLTEDAPVRGHFGIDSARIETDLGLRHRSLAEGYRALAEETRREMGHPV